MTAEFTFADGKTERYDVKTGELIMISVPYEAVDAVLTPGRGYNLGAGKGEVIQTKVYGGVTGLILDGRGRPLNLPETKEDRIANLKAWSEATNEYPEIG